MRRTAIASAAIVGSLMASSSFAALVVTATRGTSPNAPGFDVVYYRVRDNASATTAIQAQSFQFFVDAPNELNFGPDMDEFGGVLPGGNAASIASRAVPAGTFAFLPAATNVSVIPAGTGSFAEGSTAYSAQSFRTASAYTTTSADGVIVAAAVVTPGATVRAVISVNSTLDATATVDTTIIDGTPTGNVNPTVTVTPSSVTVDVAPAGLEGFGPVVVSATDSDGTVTSITAGSIPAQIADNITVSGPGTGPLSISGTGFTFADVGNYTITFTATDNLGGQGTGVLTLSIVPEPTTLAVAGLAGFGLVRRRK